MSNRFYEALYCGTVPAFDSSCLATIKKSGYDVPDDWIIDSLNDLKKIYAASHSDGIRKMFHAALDSKQTETAVVLKYIGINQ
jgi:hypothetical protein